MRHHEPRPPGRVVSKTPGERSQAWMAALGTGLLLGGAALGVAVLALRGATGGVVQLSAERLLAMLVGTALLTVATLVVHEGLHGLGMVLLKARPHFGAGLAPPGMPYLYTTCEGHLFTRNQFIVVAALPNVVVSALLLAMMAWGPHPTWWVLPFAVHLSGGVGDAWLCWAAAAERPGTLVEDQRAGLRVHRPPRVAG